ncbi:MAG TPA: hypothetical protein VGK32_11125 [Vicinamibacterales bacterium]
MILADADRFLRHFERDAALACSVMAVGALVAERGRPDGAAGVVAGGLLMAVSYGAIKGAVDAAIAVMRHEPGVLRPRRRALVAAVKFFTRYALLAVGAYAMLTCFRLHPVGLVAGATSPFLAAAAQVVRLSRAPSNREHGYAQKDEGGRMKDGG